MSKKALIILLIIVVLGGAAFLIYKSRKNNAKPAVGSESAGTKSVDNSTMIFFYGQGCPHCANVEKFLSENPTVEEKVKFEKLEVWSSKENANLLGEKAKICKIPTDQIGVPLFWDGSKCIQGDVDTIAYLKEKAGIN
jgi:thioredoxin-related protein